MSDPEQEPPLAPLLGEIFLRIIKGGMAWANRDHRAALLFLKEGARMLNVAIKRAERLAKP